MLGHCSCRGTDLQLPDPRMTGSCSDINGYTTFVQEQGRDQFGGKTHVSEQDTAAVQHSVYVYEESPPGTPTMQARMRRSSPCITGISSKCCITSLSNQSARSVSAPRRSFNKSGRVRRGASSCENQTGRIKSSQRVQKWGQVLQNNILTLIHCVEQHSSSFHREPRDIRRSVSSCSPLIGKRQPSPSFDPGPAHSHPVDVPALDIAVVGPV